MILQRYGMFKLIRCVMIYFSVHQLELTLIPAILINCQGNINQVCDR